MLKRMSEGEKLKLLKNQIEALNPTPETLCLLRDFAREQMREKLIVREGVKKGLMNSLKSILGFGMLMDGTCTHN